MSKSPSTTSNFFNQERLRQAAALAGPNADPVAVIHSLDQVSAGWILNKLRDDRAIGVAELWTVNAFGNRHYGTYDGCSRAIWNLSSQPPAPSVADSLAGVIERTSKEEKRRLVVDIARKSLSWSSPFSTQEVIEVLGLSTD
jgi:hypothetical protein